MPRKTKSDSRADATERLRAFYALGERRYMWARQRITRRLFKLAEAAGLPDPRQGRTRRAP